MEGVRPITEHWTEDVLDFLHKTVVDQVLRVNIIQARDTFPLPVNMFTKSGLDIGKMLVRNGYARGEERIKFLVNKFKIMFCID
jgi:endonuclease YncB( thermonuclease family)